MPVPQEAPINLEEQLALDDSQLAIMGIARSMAAAAKELESAERSLKFTQGYRPTPPGPRPHPEAGGMDHADWNVARLEYEQYDEESEIETHESWVREAENKLDDLYEDNELVKECDETVTSEYAQAERKRIQAEIDKQRRAEESAARWAKYKEGAEIDGSTTLSADVKALATDPILSNVRGKVSSSGWKFVGTTHQSNRLMFERLNPDAANEQEQLHWKFKKTELLALRVSDDNVSVEYARVSDIDEKAVKCYGRNIANVVTYKFNIKDSGKVAEQRHYTGPINGHLPYFMNDGTVARAEGVHGITPEPQAELDEEAIQEIQSKVAEVAGAMEDLAQS